MILVFWGYPLISVHPSFLVICRFFSSVGFLICVDFCSSVGFLWSVDFLVSVDFSDSWVSFYPYVDSANDAVLAVRGLGDSEVQPACLMVASTCCQRSGWKWGAGSRHQQFKKHPITQSHSTSRQSTHRSCSQHQCTGAVAAIRCCKHFELNHYITHCLLMFSSKIFLVISGRF